MKKLILLLSLLMNDLSHSTSENPIKVLIVGAGPSSLSVAKALQNRNIYPDIIEKSDQVRSSGSGIAIAANGTWALNKLGIDISKEAHLITSMLFTDDQGKVLTQEKIEGIHPEGAQFYSLCRDKLMELLLSHLDKRIQIHTSTSIKHFAEENNLVKVEFSNNEVKFYDLVIGCDGAHSSLRKQIHPNEVPEFLNLLAWRGVINSSEQISMPTYMLGSDRLVLLYPLPSNQIYIYGHTFQSEKSFPKEPFAKIFENFGGSVPKVIGINDPTLFYRHHMEKSHSVRFKLDGFSRVLLVGDAAHAFGPMLQNGAAQCFEDAYVIQDLLDEKIHSTSIPAFIDSFEERRHARVESIFMMSNVKIQAISDPEQIQGRNNAIGNFGAPNVNGFKKIMQQNP